MILLFLLTLSAIMPIQEEDISDQRAAYEYLFSEEEKAAYDDLKSPEERTAFWDDFWQRRDPSPLTEYNEMKELFLGRVEQSKLSFSTNDDGDNGWQTDRGKILIFFGPPREILRSPFSPRIERKVEIWVYSESDGQGNQKRVELVFEDPDGSGFFSLLTNIKSPHDISSDGDPTLPEVLPEGEG